MGEGRQREAKSLVKEEIEGEGGEGEEELFFLKFSKTYGARLVFIFTIHI